MKIHHGQDKCIAAKKEGDDIDDFDFDTTEVVKVAPASCTFFVARSFFGVHKFYCNSELSDFWRVVNHGHRFWQF